MVALELSLEEEALFGRKKRGDFLGLGWERLGERGVVMSDSSWREGRIGRGGAGRGGGEMYDVGSDWSEGVDGGLRWERRAVEGVRRWIGGGWVESPSSGVARRETGLSMTISGGGGWVPLSTEFQGGVLSKLPYPLPTPSDARCWVLLPIELCSERG